MRGTAISAFVIMGVLYCGIAEAGQVKTAKLAPAKRAAPKASTEQIHQAFDVFCAEWMGKLAAREYDNITHIAWNTKPDGVEGEYVGYTKDHTCVVKDSDSAPVGKITYVEVLYAKRGRTIEEAQQSAGDPVETTGVTELFGYDSTKWSY